VLLPPELDIHSENNSLINAALAAGLYPKILKIDQANGQLSTITNSQAVTSHPSSVNFKRRPQDFGVDYLAFFTIMWVTIPIKYRPLNEGLTGTPKSYMSGRQARWMMSLCFYSAETAASRLVRLHHSSSYLILLQLVSDTASFIDRKIIRFRIPAKTNLALKYLRNKLAVMLSERLQKKPSTGSQEKWMEIALVILGKLRPEKSSSETIVLDIIRH
jgi:ATP-dependent RNA helicase DHX29